MGSGSGQWQCVWGCEGLPCNGWVRVQPTLTGARSGAMMNRLFRSPAALPRGGGAADGAGAVGAATGGGAAGAWTCAPGTPLAALGTGTEWGALNMTGGGAVPTWAACGVVCELGNVGAWAAACT